MDNFVFESLRNKLKKCHRYKDMETAIYLSMYLSKYNKDFCILAGILLFENREYARSLSHLSRINSVTSFYFRALCYKNMKMYNEAVHCLLNILESKNTPERVNDEFVKEFLLDPQDTEFFDSLYGELMILKGNCKIGIEKYRKSMFKSPLLIPCLSLFDENIPIAPINELSEDPIMILFQDLLKLSIQNSAIYEETSNKKPAENLSAMIEEYTFVNEYLDDIPGTGSYFMSKVAAMYCKLTNTKTGTQIFQILRDKDNTFIREMDTYSTSLWISKDQNALGLLSKSLISTSPTSHITWSVIGNYYSLCGFQKESATCFMKSINIQENPTAYSLLGFEYNIKNQYLEAQNYFKSSICMLENNDRAYFGLGVSYAETFKRQASEVCFKKALQINPRSLSIKAYIVRFYVKNSEIEKAFERIKEYLNFNQDSIDDIVKQVAVNTGKYNEMEELILCELIEVLIKMKNKQLAEILLQCIQIRTSSYYSKKNLLENSN